MATKFLINILLNCANPNKYQYAFWSMGGVNCKMFLISVGSSGLPSFHTMYPKITIYIYSKGTVVNIQADSVCSTRFKD